MTHNQKMIKSKVYCQKHEIPLICLRKIDNNGDFIEVGWCVKCQKEYSEYSDVSPIFISNYPMEIYKM